MFLIELKHDCTFQNRNAINSSEFDSIEDSECLEEVIITICDALSRLDTLRFNVEGFGFNWPVSIDVDLSTVILQIYETIFLIRSSDKATIQFFEQGIERELKLTTIEQTVKIKCYDLESNLLSTKTEELSLDVFDKMLIDFLFNFVEFTKTYYRDAFSNSTFYEWKEKIYKLN